ncbi:MAG: DEAD/DEAH box helicase [Treponema sp.]|jgi:superfamily II DNA/RNA helicase|nr:DEAD/DEAH box helicase [Treponema sp.]
MTFTELGIKAELVQSLAARNIKEPSEIQRLVIPALLAGNRPESSAPGTELSDEPGAGSVVGFPHLLFSSPTGTGKTLAYALPLLQKITRIPAESPVGGPEIVVLAPTYELASQIKKEFDALLPAAFNGSGPVPRSELLIGQTPLNRQIDSLKKLKPVAVVGNPARVLQLVRMKKLSFKALRYLVLDEGDRLMADELFPETAELCRLSGGTPAGAKVPASPPERRFIACSATFSAKNRERLFSAAPDGRWEIITQKENDILKKNIEHWAFFAEEREKVDLLRSFIAAAKPSKVLVFTSRAGQVGRIVSRLQFRHLAAAGLWGDMDKKDRKAAIDGFRKGNITILVSSDLAARGLDIEGVSHIVALDIPEGEETYIHRAGRTARAGRRGIMASFGDEAELRRLARIEKKLGIAVFPKELYGGRVCAPVPEA